MASMNHLPNEVLHHIFKYLDLKSLGNCRLVSQNWKFLVDDVKIYQMVYSVSSYHPSDRLYKRRPWYQTHELISPGNIIDLHSISKLTQCPLNLSNVQRLRIDTVGNFRLKAEEEFNWNEFMGNFAKLSHLEINLFGAGRCNTHSHIYLDLPASLKTICLLDVRRVILYLNAPQLQNVSCDFSIRKIRFSHPESVKRLRITDSDSVDDHLQMFSNLEYLHLSSYSDTYINSTFFDLIELFPRLNEIHFDIDDMHSDLNVCNLEIVVNALLAQKKALGRKELNIFCDGRKIRETFYLRKPT